LGYVREEEINRSGRGRASKVVFPTARGLDAETGTCSEGAEDAS
jgi:hypothetical protein